MKNANSVYSNACGSRERATINLAERPWLVLAVALADGEAHPRMLLGVDSQGDPALDFYEHDGKLLRELP